MFGNQSSNEDFPDPFLDMASLLMPKELHKKWDLCEGIWLKNGTYRMAASRIVRYFITKVEYEDVDDGDRDDLTAFFNNSLNINEQLSLVGDEFLAYGNSLSSVVVPFQRFLTCSICRSEQPIRTADWSFKEFKFSAHCRRCRKQTPHSHHDRRSNRDDHIGIKRWSPKEIRLMQHPYNNSIYSHYWDIPADVRRLITTGDRFTVEHMPWEVIETVRRNQIFKFHDAVLYHMAEHTLAGVDTKGWGVSRMLSNFAQAYYTQVLKRYNEAIGHDFVVPFRVLTPGPVASKQADPLLHTNIAGFSAKVKGMLQQHRRDPAGWNVLPFPLQYQALGGEAKQLTTPELIDQAMDEMLNAIGIPAEMYRGTLQVQAMPTALRMFQQTWPQLVAKMNGWLQWMTGIVCTAKGWDTPGRVYLQPSTMADDVELRQVWLQLASANMISRRTAFNPWGIDVNEEQRRIMQEQKDFADMQMKFEEEMQQKMMNKQVVAGMPDQGMPAGGGMMGQPGGAMPAGAGMTPDDLMQQAQEIAGQLLQMPYEARRRELHNIKSSNETLHAMVKQMMENMRNQAASEGQQMLLQGGGGMM